MGASAISSNIVSVIKCLHIDWISNQRRIKNWIHSLWKDNNGIWGSEKINLSANYKIDYRVLGHLIWNRIYSLGDLRKSNWIHASRKSCWKSWISNCYKIKCTLSKIICINLKEYCAISLININLTSCHNSNILNNHPYCLNCLITYCHISG